MFKGKKILITGGTGSLGTALTKRLLQYDVKNIRIFSRDELKQVQMNESINDSRLRFLIGDVRDKERLFRATEGIDIVIHTAALKHVPVIEYNPFEAVQTNVYGSQNLISACLMNNVSKVLAIGTDKAVSPFNTYGATKLLMERLFVSANYYKGDHITDFLCVRYGNVLGSRGSLVPTLVNQALSKNEITITDPNMTRFNITMNEALDLIFRALKNGIGGEVFIPKLHAYRINEMKIAIQQLLKIKCVEKKIPVRPGEKFHESLISQHEIRNTYENKNDYILLDDVKSKILLKNKSIKKSKLKEEYSSNNVKLLSIDEIKKILVSENLV